MSLPRLLFDSNTADANGDATYHVYEVSVAGGEPRQLTIGKVGEGVAGWTHDGKWIQFLSDRTGRGEIWKMPAAGGPARQITKQGGRLALESPDGRYFYYAKNGQWHSDLWRVEADGGNEMLVLPKIRPMQFVPVNDGVYYVPSQAPPKGFEIRFHSWVTGQERVVVSVRDGSPELGLSLAPDGKSLLFVKREPAEGDLMMVQMP